MTWLLDRLFEQQKQPVPRFAFLSTVNWMRALAILVEGSGFAQEALCGRFSQVQRRQPNEEADTLSFSNLLMAMHNVAALVALAESQHPYAVVRSGIVAWYYAIYYAAKAMIASTSGHDPQTHAKASRVWQNDVSASMVVIPFAFALTDLTPRSIETQMSQLRGDNPYDLTTAPVNEEQALGAVLSYLKGTAEYERDHLEKKVRKSPQFREQGFADFRKAGARTLRDVELSAGHVNILTQAFRYRGKANYRDAIYLSYGSDYTNFVKPFMRDLETVAKAFSYMAAHYVAKRVISINWQHFSVDVEKLARFKLPFGLGQICQ